MAQEWGYQEHNGPHTWADHFTEATGERQSPIDIQTNSATLDPKLSRNQLAINWPKKTLDVTNTGYCWKAHVHGEGSTLTGGPLKDTYQLEQFHCHWGTEDNVGSEHTVDGEAFAAEIHFVHWNTKYGSLSEALKHGDGLAVLGVFVKNGSEHSEVNQLIKVLPSIQFKDQSEKFTEPLDPLKLLPANRAYWTYLGSLTTPPCTECVVWIVFKDAIEMSHDQLQAFRNMNSLDKEQCCACSELGEPNCIVQNFRPCCPRGERPVRASYS